MGVARTILAQIGNGSLWMIGAKGFVDKGDGVQFKIMKNQAGANRVTITLTPADTYTVELSSSRLSQKAPEGYTNKIKATFEDVYADNLKSVISEATGLALSL